MTKDKLHEITKEMQLKELTERITPILNVDVIVYKHDFDKKKNVMKGEYLIGLRNKKKIAAGESSKHQWLFPGGRVKFTESPQEAAERILRKEAPGIKAHLKKIVTALSDKGYDRRAYGVTIYFLFEYVSGEPKVSDDFEKFKWVTPDSLQKIKNVHQPDATVMNEVEAAVRTMNASQEEVLVEVDKNNKEIGSIIKRDAHNNPKRYHRSAHIMIFNTQGQVVLQLRSQNKAVGAGKWDMHGGHQVLGMTIEQTAYQELAEELGVHVPLTFVRFGLYKSSKQAEFYYLYYGISDGPYGFDRNEVQEIKTFDCDKLLQGKYDKDYDIFEHVYKYTRELKNVWSRLVKS